MSNFERGTDLYSRFVGRYADGLGRRAPACRRRAPRRHGAGRRLRVRRGPRGPRRARRRAHRRHRSVGAVPRARAGARAARGGLPRQRRGVAVPGRLVRPGGGPARGQLHERRARGRGGDAAGRAAHRGGLRVGLRRRHDDAARVLGRSARARPRGAGREHDALSKRGQLGDLWTQVGCATSRTARSSSPPATRTSTISGSRSRRASPPPAATARRCRRTARPRCARRTSGSSAQPQGPFELTARAWYATGTV